MDVKIEETTIIHPSTPPFNDDHVLSLSHLDTDINLHVTFRYLRVYVNDPETQTREQPNPFHVVTSSLSSALVQYYHYTGSLIHRVEPDDRLELHCQAGNGVPVTRAVVACTLSEMNYLDDPDESFTEKLVPDPRGEDALTRPFILQVTRFKCGGWVLGAAIHHTLCDGLGATIFFNAMAELARGAGQVKLEPVWARSSLLGPRDPPRVDFPFHEFLSLDKNSLPYMEPSKPAVRECFKVKDEWLDRLKGFLREQSGSNYTTFEALGAFIWRARVMASKIPSKETVKFAYATNIRRTMKPQLPHGYWGNGCVPMYVQLLAQELVNQPLSKTADSIKNSKFNTTDEYVRSFIDFQELHYHEGITAGERVSGFTDWRHLGHATVDFGWGGPVTVFPLSRHLVGSIEPCFFLPYSSASEGKKDGFKVLVYLQEEAMADFKKEMEKLEHIIGLSRF
ncbi:fatty alcohol:caffeoyl-CoA acyltransferase-like [Lycium barbarum]|uniref:fatty alcohol:caffeoyl-CoA acyltransferase-like n=1 Tax=Lycium barbarum TaxID=112863 RepID=UPI00293F6CE5|nr:fatty alcohol:caffeoyl-CoA acyltransferase-like [Lycium barbarum]